MSRRVACIWVIAFGLALGILYHIRYQAKASWYVQKQVRQALQAAKQNQALLEAEWGSLNDPRYLQKLSEQYLDLVPLQATQLRSSDKAKPHRPMPVAGR